MAEPFDSIIKDLKKLMDALKKDSADLLSLLKKANLLDTNNDPTSNLSKELKDLLAAFVSQGAYTFSTSKFLAEISTTTASADDLKTVANLIQIYFQVTQPLEKILSDLLDNLPSSLQNNDVVGIETSVQTIKTNRNDLQEAQDIALQEFGDVLDELSLEQLVRASNSIKIELKNLSNPSFLELLAAINRLINHLENASKFFSDFSKNNGDLTNNEPSQIKTLISNWRESISIIETLEQTDLIRQELSYPGKSRSAIAQSIKIHDLLEANYDFLTALVRSIDLVSAGSL
jgi:hypothetical protein